MTFDSFCVSVVSFVAAFCAACSWSSAIFSWRFRSHIFARCAISAFFAVMACACVVVFARSLDLQPSTHAAMRDFFVGLLVACPFGASFGMMAWDESTTQKISRARVEPLAWESAAYDKIKIHPKAPRW